MTRRTNQVTLQSTGDGVKDKSWPTENMKDTWLILPIELTAMDESLKAGQTGLRI